MMTISINENQISLYALIRDLLFAPSIAEYFTIFLLFHSFSSIHNWKALVTHTHHEQRELTWI